MKLATLAAAISIVTLSSVAHADDSKTQDDEFLAMGFIPQIGIGMVGRLDHDSSSMLKKTAFDGSLRWGPVWNVAPRTHAGGFIEMRTVSFDTFDFAIGPQVQVRIGKDLAVQGRFGVGAEMEGDTFALAGVQIGNFLGGATVTGRRFFDDDRTEISLNLEVTSAVLLLPVWIATVR